MRILAELSPQELNVSGSGGSETKTTDLDIKCLPKPGVLVCGVHC